MERLPLDLRNIIVNNKWSMEHWEKLRDVLNDINKMRITATGERGIDIAYGFKYGTQCKYVYRDAPRMSFIICVKCGNYMQSRWGDGDCNNSYLPSPIYCNCADYYPYLYQESKSFPLSSVITTKYIENLHRRDIYVQAHPNMYTHEFKYSRLEEKDNDRYGIWSKYKMYKVFN